MTSIPRPTPATPRTSPLLDELSDEALDQFIETRLRLAGVDLSVLPEDDPDAPADRVRVYRSARNFLRNTAMALSAFDLDPQLHPPVGLPGTLVALDRAGTASGDGP
jgi:hypothetical protein